MCIVYYSQTGILTNEVGGDVGDLVGFVKGSGNLHGEISVHASDHSSLP
jgi:hypothetical protein